MAVRAVGLFFVMALFGVQVIGAIAMPVVGGVVTLVTRRPRIWWEWGALAYQWIVGGATYAIGIGIGLDWWVALIVAFLIFITSYARPYEKYPGQLEDAYGYSDGPTPGSELVYASGLESQEQADYTAHRRDRHYECTICGKGLVTENGLHQHMASKHGPLPDSLS